MTQLLSTTNYSKSLLLSLLFCTVIVSAHAQVKDSKGTDFWLTFNGNYLPANATASLFISSEFSTSGVVAAPGVGFSVPFVTTPGTVTTVALPASIFLNSSNIILNNGLHVTALQEVTVYGLNRQQASTDAFLGLPTDVLGRSYINIGFGNSGVVNGTQFGIVAPHDATTVTITPTITTNGHAANIPYDIVLDQGQTYQLRNSESTSGDLSGSIITSDKPIAVFGSHRCANVPGAGYTFCDHLVEQLVPTDAWGKNFVTVPLKTRKNGDTFRFLASENGTTVQLNGSSVATLNKGQFLQTSIVNASQITSDKPILVAQYSNGTSYDGVVSDPFMLLVFPFEQFLNSYTVSTPASGFNFNFINVAVPAAAVGILKLDNAVIPSASFTPIGSTGYFYAQLTVGLGVHTLNGTALPFGISVYGFDNADSYGYPGGGTFAPIASVTSVSISPKSGTGNICTGKCFAATVKDGQNNPLVGVRVDFNITGANASSSGFANTNAQGIASFCYTGPNAGADNIAATVGTVSDNASYTWTQCPSVATSITISPKSGTDKVCNSSCFTALVKDQYNTPMAGQTITFTITGANPGSPGSAVTNASGIASFCYSGPNTGVDNINASLGSLHDNASFTWTTCVVQECNSPVDVLYVDANVSTSGNGGTWQCAMKQLSDAIAYANTHSSIKAIWVADGVYKPTIGVGRAATMLIARADLKILGGFAGGETNAGDANPDINVSLISGDIGVGADATDNCYHMITIRGLASNPNPLWIDGFKLMYGNANVSGGGNNYGGAIIAYSNNAATPIRISRTNFSSNNAMTQGGAIYADRTNIMYDRCVFFGNTSASGGAVFGFFSSSAIYKTVFEGNNAKSCGGAYYANFGTSRFEKTVFVNNRCQSGGGGIYQNQATATYYNCVFSENIANQGAAVYQHYNSNSQIINSSFYGNEVRGDFANGAALVLGLPVCQTQMANSIFYGNKKNGSAVVSGADFSNFFAGSNTANIFAHNILQVGTAIPSDNGVTIINNLRGVNPLFVNTATAAGADGKWFTTDDGLKLQPASPAANSGLNTATSLAGITEDINDDPRIACTIVDRGAYESFCAGVPNRELISTNAMAEHRMYETSIVSNPFSSDLQIRYTGDEKCAATIYDGNGRVVIAGRNISQGLNQLDATMWPRGMYQVVIISGSGKRMLFKAMKL